MKLFSSRNRPLPLGRYPLERLLRRDLAQAELLAARGASHGPDPVDGNALAGICADYGRIYEAFRAGEAAPRKAPYTQDLSERSADLKGLAYFFDATLVGCCALPATAWTGEAAAHDHALVILVEHAPDYEASNPIHEMLAQSGGAAARLRATEIAVILALYLRRLGSAATAHTPAATDLSLELLAVNAGLARLSGARLHAPFIGDRFALAAVSTDLALPIDRPLAPAALADGGAAWLFGIDGTETWWTQASRRARPGEWGPYPMERVKRAPETTTLILDDEVPRVGKRSDGFVRAYKGDLGDKAQRELFRFAGKTPLSNATRVLMGAQQPHQDGQVAPAVAEGSLDPAANRRAVKTLLHHLGADIAGTCQAKPYCWYSHELDGTPIETYHPSAVVMVIDQGFDTMEGASGDDWISATQSMRAYLRGAQIAGVAAAWIRSLGHAARAHTSVDSDVVQTPLVLLAGLGEMSRIGEVILNPFIGPRSKSAVITTNLPLAYDRPIDFNLQDACATCMKCARECPCDAITYGAPVMFNGYEQWKQDVQRCTAYRVTNQGGSACGRCMKTCPYNHEGRVQDRALIWAANHFAPVRRRLRQIDDRKRAGSINPVKRWWQELEIVDGEIVKPARTNRRELDLAKGFALQQSQTIAYTNADMLPAPDADGSVRMDRKAGMAAADVLETPAQARARRLRGDPAPSHYRQTPLKFPYATPEQRAERAKTAHTLLTHSTAEAAPLARAPVDRSEAP